jgi:DNA-binding NarL/FixJ family response regulator
MCQVREATEQLARDAGRMRTRTGRAATISASSFETAELRVARHIANGLANPAIAVELGLSKRTVEHHVANIYLKLGVNNRIAAAQLVVAG